MVSLTTPEPPPEVNEQEIALNASDFAHLHRALLWLLILFAARCGHKSDDQRADAVVCGHAVLSVLVRDRALIQYFFLRIEASDLSDHQYNRAIAKQRLKPNAIGRSDPLVASRPGLPDFARTGQWVIFFVGTDRDRPCFSAPLLARPGCLETRPFRCALRR